MINIIALSFAAANTRLTLNEPVVLYFTVKNSSGRQVKLDLGRDRKEAFLFTVKAPDGKSVRLPQRIREGIAERGTFYLDSGRTYTQKILLNEWFDEFIVPGKYELVARIANSVRGHEGVHLPPDEFQISLEIEPRDPRRLEQLCAALALEIRNSTSYQQAAEAASELSYIKDSIAVPYLEYAMLAGRMVETVAVAGLERIGGNEAVGALISGLTTGSQDVAERARSALTRFEEKTTDTSLKERIRRALTR
jgi:hypothetical protein